MNRISAPAAWPVIGLLACTLGAIAWYATTMLPLRHELPGFWPFFLVFYGCLGLPYLLSLARLAAFSRIDALRLACASALVNAAWSLPLAGLMVLLSGLAMGNRQQLHATYALVLGAALQLPLAAAAAWALRRSRPPASAEHAQRSTAMSWLIAIVVPVCASGAAFLYLSTQIDRFKARGAEAMQGSRLAEQAFAQVHACLVQAGQSGYPARLDACAAAGASVEGAYRFDYRPGLPDAQGRIGAFLLCAQPRRFRVTGFETHVGSSGGLRGQGVPATATIEHPPTCASALGLENAVIWCAYDAAARDPRRGYPRRLQEMSACIGEHRQLMENGPDRAASEPGQGIAYVAGESGGDGRVTSFRVYRFGRAGEQALWIDEQLRSSSQKARTAGPVLPGLPDVANPAPFEPGCAGGTADDCFKAGHEWQRKARQSGRGEDADMIAQAIVAFERGCDLGDGRSCSWLADELEQADRRHVVRAAALNEKACALGYSTGCRKAAETFESGRRGYVVTLQSPAPANPPAGVGRDPLRAVGLFERACDLGDEESCFIGARLVVDGEKLPVDRGRGLGLFVRACDGGLALGCERAADLAPERAAYLRRTACALGRAESCAPQ